MNWLMWIVTNVLLFVLILIIAEKATGFIHDLSVFTLGMLATAIAVQLGRGYEKGWSLK